MNSAWFWTLALGVPLLVAPAKAGAMPSQARRFGYQAPAECPNSEDFSAQVAARTARWLAPSAPFTVTLAINRGAQGFVGRVTFARAEQRTVRELEAAGCNELVPALAFIVAVLIDPQAGTAPLPAPVERRAAAVSPGSTGAPAPQPLPAPLWFVAGPEAALEMPFSGHAALAERLFLGLGRGERSLPLSSARLSLGRVGSHASSPITGALADFVLETARLEGCVLRLNDAGFAFEPCPFVELGRLRAVGLHRGGNVTSDQLWGSLGLSLRPSWTIAHRLVLGAGLGAALPLGRYRFAFTGEPELTHTVDLAFEASLSLGLRFP